jgi:myo-inositol-hexaphosphate 3-phosphohydrolase
MGRVDHQPRGLSCLARQFGENLVEHTKAAPAHKPIVNSLVRTVLAGRVAPSQPVPDDKDDPADDPAVIHPGNAVR